MKFPFLKKIGINIVNRATKRERISWIARETRAVLIRSCHNKSNHVCPSNRVPKANVMFLHEELAPVPEWQDVNMIIKELRDALDSIDLTNRETWQFRSAIARTIAMMREEKIYDVQLKMARRLTHQFRGFKLKNGGMLCAFPILNDLFIDD